MSSSSGSIEAGPCPIKADWRLFGFLFEVERSELKQFEREREELLPKEREETVALVSSWERRGIELGLKQGSERVVMRLLHRRLGTLPSSVQSQLDGLTVKQWEDLGEALLDFGSMADPDQWLAGHITV